MRLFHRFRKETSEKRSKDDDLVMSDDDRPQHGEEESSSLLQQLEITDDQSHMMYYELPPPTLGVTRANTALITDRRRRHRHLSTVTTEQKTAGSPSTGPISTTTTTSRSTLPATSSSGFLDHRTHTFSPTNVNSRRRNKSISTKGGPVVSRLYATLGDLPHLVHTLQTSTNVTCEEASHTLRRIFALSEYTTETMRGGGTTRINTESAASDAEYESLEETRKLMVIDPSCLVPTLFHFLIRCYVEDNSSPLTSHHQTSLENSGGNHFRRAGRGDEQIKSKRTISHPVTMYLALLVLNNLCIPNDNKRYIAFQCHGIDIICHLLCYDPSCRMLAIVLVNLTFGTNVQFQHDLLFENETNTDTELLSSLAYVLRVASLTRDEFSVRQRLFVKEAHQIFGWDSRYNTLSVDSPTREQQLNALLVFDQYGIYTKSWPLPAEQMYPDTARWCICALHHLTRPMPHALNHLHAVVVAAAAAATVDDDDPYCTAIAHRSSAAMALTRTGIVQHLLCCIRIGTSQDVVPTDPRPQNNHRGLASALICHSSTDHQMLPDDLVVVVNDPSTWVKETSQDAALFVIMNISIDPYGRKYLLGHDIDTVYLLAAIADSYRTFTDHSDRSPVTKVELSDAMKVKQFQIVKARMTLSYLLGSQGHYGQEKARVGKWVKDYIHNRQVLAMKNPFEVEMLLDVLAHTMYRRTKEGPGGFSGTTFRIKYIVWAIRCLLTQPENQEMFAGNGMEVLNAFLIKILALRAIRNATYIDSDTAEHACFSLYLLSHYGFHICFLPSSLGKDYNVRHIVTKTLLALQSMKDTTLATHHAARQILNRLRYLLCIDTAASMAAITSDTFIFEKSLVNSLRNTFISEKVRSGAQPRPDIFNRPIISCRRRRGYRDRNLDGDGNTNTVSTYYNSAIHAAYDFSFQSTMTQRVDEATIDDIAIANNIANCADGKPTVELYGCSWTWDDDDGIDDLVNIDNNAKRTLEGEIVEERRRRPRGSNGTRLRDGKNDHKTSSQWSSLLFSPRTFCVGGAPCNTFNDDESCNEKSME